MGSRRGEVQFLMQTSHFGLEGASLPPRPVYLNEVSELRNQYWDELEFSSPPDAAVSAVAIARAFVWLAVLRRNA